MSSGDTKISICSSAMNLLGEAAIPAMDDDTDAARVCAQLYDTRKWSLLSEYPWSCSKKKVPLSRLVSTPVSRWKHQFQMPTDRVGDVFALLPSASVDAQVLKDYELQGSLLLANHAKLWLDYQYNVLEANMPPHFVQLLIYALTADFCMPITHETTVAAYWREVAFGSPSDNNRGGYFRVATGVDSRGRPAEVMESTELVDVRNG